jgi:SH3-like domain-containing protein
METKYGFTKMTPAEFEGWISAQRVARTILTLQQHHTWNPDYLSFTGDNHFELQKGMRDYHVTHNGWQDIGQHFSIFPDGMIVTGRSLEKSPACIFGFNVNSICIENVGNFDLQKDIMREAQKNSIVDVTASLCHKFSIPVHTDKIVYHHWFNLSNGERNNGTKNNKSCPGTAFFGGNKVEDCKTHFLPLVRQTMNQSAVDDSHPILKYVCVTSAILNIRKQPNGSAEKATDRGPAELGAILRVFKIQNNWYKISGSKQHWVSGRYTQDAKRGTVKADTLNVRNGPGADFSRVGSFLKNQEVFIIDEVDGWGKVSMEEKWVNTNFLTFH